MIAAIAILYATKAMKIAFEGCHRSGKGTQINLLSERLTNELLKHIVLRGDGSREAGEYWVAFNNQKEVLSKCDWTRAAKVLVTELAKEIVENKIVILDRSILSRASLSMQTEKCHVCTAAYKNPCIGYNDEQVQFIAPDILFLLDAPTEKLLERISSNDPKAQLRKRNILDSNLIWRQFPSKLPPDISKYKDRIVKLDGTLNIVTLHSQIIEILISRFGTFKSWQ